MADVTGEVGAVQRVKMQRIHAFINQLRAQLGTDYGCQEIFAVVTLGF